MDTRTGWKAAMRRLTRKAAEKASAAAKSEGLGEQNTMKLDAKSQRSLKAGSRFNDVYHSGNIPFALKLYLSYGMSL